MDVVRFEDPGPETPLKILEAIRANPQWSSARRDAMLDGLIRRFPLAELADVVETRLNDLSGPEAEVLLRLVEAIGSDDLIRDLATSLERQPDLPPERAFEALAVVDGAGLLGDYPELTARWDELAELLEEEDGRSIDQLAGQIEDDPDEIWVALHGLGAVEPEVRCEIVASLARAEIGPGVVEFLRLLVFGHDPDTRAAAFASLESDDRNDLTAAWASIAADHPDQGLVARALMKLGGHAGEAIHRHSAAPRPEIVRSLVTPVDGEGRAQILITSTDRGRRTTVAFVADLVRGLPESLGQIDPDGTSGTADGYFRQLTESIDGDAIVDDDELALGLLAGCLLLCGPETNPSLAFWLERAVGPGFRPRPFPGEYGWDPASVPHQERVRHARAVLEQCGHWADDSDLTRRLAAEISGRHGLPDPGRDAGAYRYLFEHRIRDRIELYRRMLFWMAAFWHAAGEIDLGRSALAMAYELSDPQHAVPGHPFVVALSTLSLTAAQQAADVGREIARD